MWIEPKGFSEVDTRGNTEAHRLQDPAKWVPFGGGAIEGQAARPLRILEGGEPPEATAAALPPDPTPTASATPPDHTPARKYGPGEEPRPKDGEPTGSAHGELL
jgi:hypothetical protein